MNELQAIWQELIELTNLRQRVERENDTISRLFAPLRDPDAQPATWEQFEQAKEALEKKIPSFYVWFLSGKGYGLFPKSSYKKAEGEESK